MAVKPMILSYRKTCLCFNKTRTLKWVEIVFGFANENPGGLTISSFLIGLTKGFWFEIPIISSFNETHLENGDISKIALAVKVVF